MHIASDVSDIANWEDRGREWENKKKSEGQPIHSEQIFFQRGLGVIVDAGLGNDRKIKVICLSTNWRVKV